MRRPGAAAAMASLLLLAAGCASSSRVPTYCADLRGAGPGSDALDPDATGSARLEIGGSSIRFHIQTVNLGKVVATHLHQGPAGVNGPMAVELSPGFAGDVLDGSIPVDSDLAARVLANPSQYYVKLHSLKFPGGAIRGQLEPCGKRATPSGRGRTRTMRSTTTCERSSGVESSASAPWDGRV